MHACTARVIRQTTIHAEVVWPLLGDITSSQWPKYRPVDILLRITLHDPSDATFPFSSFGRSRRPLILRGSKDAPV